MRRIPGQGGAVHQQEQPPPVVEGSVRQRIVGAEATGDHRGSGFGDGLFQEREMVLGIVTRTGQVPGC